MSQTVIRSLEAGTNHLDLTLGDLVRLGDLLTLSLPEMLAQPTPAVTCSSTGRGDAAAAVGALLLNRGRLTPVETIAEATRATISEVEATLVQLDQRLRPAGLVVHRLGNQVKIWHTGTAVAPETLQEVWRRSLARLGLNRAQATLLAAAAAGRRVKAMTKVHQVTAAELVNAGILARSASGGVELADDVRYSLLLDDPTATDGPAGR